LAEFRRVNVEGTLNLARQAVGKGVVRFIFISTIKVNGEETVDRPFGADDKPAPKDPYSISKLEAEIGLRRIAGETGLEVVIIRPPLIYGPGAGGNFAKLLGLVREGWFLPFGSIRNTRSLIGIDNLCSLITICLTHPAAANRILPVSDGEDVSTPELIRHLARSCGRPARILPVPASLLNLLAKILGKEAELHRLTGNLQVDSSQTRRLLNWQPPLRLEEGIRRCVTSSDRI
ncbi:MAG: NAD-dependent epimerase/dehydratase family protein, partial [Desulforhopalus sp.]